MKILIAVVALTLLLGGGQGCPALADDMDTTHWVQDTGRGNYTTPIDPLTAFLNENDYIYHSHGIYLDQRRNPVGPGADVVLFQSQNALLEEVTAEYRYDINNDEHIIFGVARVNLFKAITNMFQ